MMYQAVYTQNPVLENYWKSTSFGSPSGSYYTKSKTAKENYMLNFKQTMEFSPSHEEDQQKYLEYRNEKETERLQEEADYENYLEYVRKKDNMKAKFKRVLLQMLSLQSSKKSKKKNQTKAETNKDCAQYVTEDTTVSVNTETHKNTERSKTENNVNFSDAATQPKSVDPCDPVLERSKTENCVNFSNAATQPKSVDSYGPALERFQNLTLSRWSSEPILKSPSLIQNYVPVIVKPPTPNLVPIIVKPPTPSPSYSSLSSSSVSSLNSFGSVHLNYQISNVKYNTNSGAMITMNSTTPSVQYFNRPKSKR